MPGSIASKPEPLMDWYVRAFIRSSATWLVLGVSLGLAMVLKPEWALYRVAHMHMLLLGFVSMMIFGFGYHVVPRLAGNRLYNSVWAGAHVWLANSGLALLTVGFSLRAHALEVALYVTGAGGILATLGAYLFAANVLLSTREKKRTTAPAARPARELPTLAAD
jgi:heme/copper-type cytochrome/quinol oxidase subunit 1